MTARQLADALEVSIRTIYRDIEALQQAGIPLWSEQGPNGGFRLVDGYRTRLNGLNNDEAEALFLAGLPGPAAELGLGTVVAAAELKVLAALPPELRPRAARLNQRFHLDAPAWFRESENVPFLAQVASTVWADRRIRIRYRSWEGEGTRTVDPLGLVLKTGLWYLVAQQRVNPRIFRVSRILSLTELDESFKRDDSFDLMKFWASESQEFERSLFQDEAAVRLSPRGFEELELHLGEPRARVARSTAETYGSDGWQRVKIPITSLDDGVRDFLKFGADVVVEYPVELRYGIAATVKSMNSFYV